MPGSNNYSQRPDEEDQQKVIPTGQSGGPTPPPPTVQEQPVSNNQELINVLERQLAENPLETPEQRKRREKREKWEGIIGGISDAANAVSNLIFTTKGAPNMYNHANSMTEATQRRKDKAQAERDKRLNNYLNYAMTLGRAKDADRGWRFQLQQYKDAQAQRAHDNALADAKAKRDNAMYQLNMDLAQHKIDAAKAAAVKSQIDAQYAAREAQARINRENASAGASNARANYYDRGGSGGKPAEFVGYAKDGTEHRFRDAKAWEAFSRREGTWVEGEKTTKSTTTRFGSPETTETTTSEGGYSKKPVGQSPLMKKGKEKNEQSKAEW